MPAFTTLEKHLHMLLALDAVMVLPPIPPLHPEAWNEFMAALRRGPTPNQVKVMEEARKLARHMVQTRNMDSKRQGSPDLSNVL